MKKFGILTLLFLWMLQGSARAAQVTVKMNTRTYCMTLTNKVTGVEVAPDSPATESKTKANNYVFNDLEAGQYVVSGRGYSSGKLYDDVGKLEITVSGEAQQTFEIGTMQLKIGNSGWTEGIDFTVENMAVYDADGNAMTFEVGHTPQQNGFFASLLYLKNGTVTFDVIPSEARQAERYETLHYSKTLTSVNQNETLNVVNPYFSVSVPEAAQLQLSFKPTYSDHNQPSSQSMGMAHYVPFTMVQPVETSTAGGTTTYTYRLQADSYYTYRTWMEGKATLAGRFTKQVSADNDPQIAFTVADYNGLNPKWQNHVESDNDGYNIANIMLNINAQGHLKMQPGETKDLLAQRDWQIVSTLTENYFLEPCYHYHVTNLQGQPDESVVRLNRTQTDTDPWVQLEAVAEGTAIVTVCYDALQYDIYNGKTKGTPAGNSNRWSALWPENTGVFVVSVGHEDSGIVTGMTINEGKNDTAEKLAGDAVDAESDVFYYSSDTDGYPYTFTPKGAARVEIAYPAIGTSEATYPNGFSTEGVTQGDDGSYTVLLRRGRQIVRLTNAAGQSEYQVLTAKPCSFAINNLTHPGEEMAHPGDKVSVQFSGLYHPANKMSAVYNMSAYISYLAAEGGKSLYEGANQYGFASSATAQCYSIKLSEDLDTEHEPTFRLADGNIMVIGYGDAIGNHRNIQKDKGLNANTSAISHQGYMGKLPVVDIPLQPADFYVVSFEGLPNDASVSVSDADQTAKKADDDGTYRLLPGAYTYTVEAEGYATETGNVCVVEGGQHDIVVAVNMVKDSECWDGETAEAPSQVTTDEAATPGSEYEGLEGFYKIATAENLAWMAQQVANGQNAVNAVLTADIHLGNKPWTPIGTNTANLQFKGKFYGNNHTVSGLYVSSEKGYNGLFGYVNGAEIRDLTVQGVVNKTNSATGQPATAGIVGYATGTAVAPTTLSNLHFSGSVIAGEDSPNAAPASLLNQYVAGIVGNAAAYTNISHCSNQAFIFGCDYVGGIAANLQAKNCTISDCYNLGFISGTSLVGGIVGNIQVQGTPVERVYNYGDNLSMRSKVWYNNYATDTKLGAITGHASNNSGIKSAYATQLYRNDKATTQMPTTAFADGQIAWLLGDDNGWRQTIGIMDTPRQQGMIVYKADECDFVYYNQDQENNYRTYTIALNDKQQPRLPASLATLYAQYATFHREVEAGRIVSFVLPFNIPLASLNGCAHLLQGVQGASLLFDEASSDVLPAHTPCLVQPETDGQLINTELRDVLLTTATQSPNITLSQTNLGTVTHVGAYQSRTVAATDNLTYYGLSAGQFVSARTGTLHPFRTMITIESSDPARPQILNVAYGTPTAVDSANGQPKSSAASHVYDLLGRPLRDEAGKPSHTDRGTPAPSANRQVLIVNGKKVVR